MARIAGVDLPNKKRMEYALTYIFGIGLHNSRLILNATGIDYNKRAFELTEDEAALIRKEIQENYLVEGDLRKKVAMDIKSLMDLGSLALIASISTSVGKNGVSANFFIGYLFIFYLEYNSTINLSSTGITISSLAGILVKIPNTLSLSTFTQSTIPV